MNTRLIDIDKLRAIAALSVLYFHATNTVSNYPASQLIRDSGVLGYLGVDIFFVISGFIIPLSMWHSDFIFKQHWKIFILKRIIRIEPSYIASIIATVLIGYVANYILQKNIYQYTLPQFLSHLFYLTPVMGYDWISPVYWTLAIEFQFYIGLLFLYTLFLNNKCRILLFICIASISFFLKDSKFIFKYLPVFLVGISAFLFHTKLIEKLEFTLLFVVSVACAIATIGAISGIVCLVTTAVILFIKLPDSKFLVLIGSISYSTYLFHYPVVEKIVRLGKIAGQSITSQLVVVVFSIAASLAISYLMYVLIEKPSMLAAARLKYTNN